LKKAYHKTKQWRDHKEYLKNQLSKEHKMMGEKRQQVDNDTLGDNRVGA